MTHTQVWAIVCAAGAGKRLGGERPKAFAVLAGRPLLAESLERLEACDAIGGIVVAAPAGWEEPVILLAEELDCGKVSSVVAGGKTRGESVRLALEEIPAEAELVLVHDAARPLVSSEIVARVLEPLERDWEAVVPALPVIDTIKRAASERIVETLERGSLVAVQTPQAFRGAVLRAAYAAGRDGATDDAALVEEQGGRVCWVEGDPRLHKVTTREDLELVESWIFSAGER